MDAVCTNSLYSISLQLSLSLWVSPLDGIQCLYRADECKFLLVRQQWCVCLCVEVHRKILCMSLSCPACLSYLTWMVCEMGGKWLYCYFLGCSFHDLFKTACNILLNLAFSSGVLFKSTWCNHTLVLIQLCNPTSS